jgi:AcrR family transcriptional regulator
MASLYHHFGSKQELLVAIMREAMADLTTCVSEAVDAAGDDPRERLAAAMRAHVRFHTEHRPEVIVADAELRSLDEPGRSEIIALRDRHQAIFREPIEALDVAQPGIVTAGVITMCTDVAMWFRSDGPLDADEVAETYVALVLRGIDR